MKTIEINISIDSLLNKEYPIIIPGLAKQIVDNSECTPRSLDINIPNILEENVAYNTIGVAYLTIPFVLETRVDNMGIFSDFSFLPLGNLTGGTLSIYYRFPNLDVTNYYSSFDIDEFISGYTTDYLDLVKSYNQSTPFVVDLNLSKVSSAFSGVLSVSDEKIVYVINGEINNLGNYIQDTGVVFETFLTETLVYFDTITKDYVEILKTVFRYKKVGWNFSNIDLYQNVKEEVYFGQVFREEENYDVNIDRENQSVLEPHLRLAEVGTLNDLLSYNRNFYNF